MKALTKIRKSLKSIMPKIEDEETGSINFVNKEDWNPHNYQKRSVKFLLEHAAAGLLLDPGLGKTSITLAAIKFLKKKGMINKVLLVAPLRVCHSVWPQELEKWTDFNGLTITLLHGLKKDLALQKDADIYLINPEGLEWLLQITKVRTAKNKVSVSMNMKRWKAFGFDTLIIDELTDFKHPQSVRFKAVKMALGTFQRRWGLTGSPSPNGLLDLFGQCYILDQGNALGKYITHYRMKYFNQGHDGFSWDIREGSEEEIYKRVAPLMLRLAAEDYIEMPELIKHNIYVDLPDSAMKVYKELENELITQIKKRVVVAKNSASAIIKCRQISNGGIYLDPLIRELSGPKVKREWANLHEEKLDALEELIDELQGSPLLVAYDFEQDLNRLQKRFGKNIPYIGGGVSGPRALQLEKLWNAGKLPVLFGHPQSISHGLNLQKSGNHICWHSLTYDYNRYDQLNRRVWRQGSIAKKVFVHHIVARDTIDEEIMEILVNKQTGQNALFAALQRLSRRR